MSNVDYQNTYWCNKGKFQKLQEALADLVPNEGEVPNGKTTNRQLEKFRVASNCYYDLYNNGLCNRAREFAAVFGFSGKGPRNRGLGYELTQEVVNKTEEAMNRIILLAGAEQNLIEGVTVKERTN